MFLRALLVDDHNLFRQGVKFLLSDLDKSIEFFEADSCATALALTDAEAIDLILLDLHMPGIEGLDALTAIRKAFESSVVVVLSGEDDPKEIRKAIENGACGFVPKSSTPEVLIAALRLILAGGTYLPASVLQGVSGSDPSPEQQGAITPDRLAGGLSERQLEVLLKAVQGKSNKVIAREMNISGSTVKAHLSASFRALGVQNRTGAVFAAAKLGLTERAAKRPGT
jgi:DNA-binding NarL/FixJ family response regulator